MELFRSGFKLIRICQNYVDDRFVTTHYFCFLSTDNKLCWGNSFHALAHLLFSTITTVPAIEGSHTKESFLFIELTPALANIMFLWSIFTFELNSR